MKGDISMEKLKLAGGSSSENSVSYFLENGKGIEAIRQEDGTIVTKEIDSNERLKTNLRLIKFIFFCSMFREIGVFLNWPKIIYHLPTTFWTVLFLIAVIRILRNREQRMFHGAEHKVYHWYNKKERKFDFESIKRCSRIHGRCGTNLLATIVTFQLMSSICYKLLGFHIPEIITAMLPLYVFKFFPFNILGLIAQLFTTAEPEAKHIDVAVEVLTTLLEKENSK